MGFESHGAGCSIYLWTQMDLLTGEPVESSRAHLNRALFSLRIPSLAFHTALHTIGLH